MPTMQQQAARMTREAWEGLMRTAAFVPAEKRDWIPQGKTRTIHGILAECVTQPEWHADFLRTGEFPPFDREVNERAKAELNSLEKIKVRGEASIRRLCEILEAVPDAKLAESRAMPWGMTMTGADQLFISYWNLTYHLGQVSYVQMLLGDTEMH